MANWQNRDKASLDVSRQTRRGALIASFGGLVGASGLLLGTSSLSGCGPKKPPKGVLRVALRGSPDSLDPLRAEFAISALLFRQYMLPIVGYGKDGAPDVAIAESWTPSADFKTWTFKIKSGLKWSDGQDITAEDVAQSIIHSATQAPPYPDGSELFAIKGYRAAVVEGAPGTQIGVRAPDNGTVIVELESADARFPATFQEFYPVPLHVVATDPDHWTDVEKIVVSGPFKPVLREPVRISFEANKNGAWVEGMPEKFEVATVEDPATRVRMFQAGNVDLAQDPPLAQLQELGARFGAQLRNTPAPRWIYVSFNTKNPKLADPEIRRALAMGIDRETICNVLLNGAVQPAGRFMRNEQEPAFDPEAATAILSAKGFNAANPLAFELMVTKDEKERAAIQMASDWAKIGVKCTLFAADSTAIVSRLNAHDFEAAIAGLDKGLKNDPLELLASYAKGGTAYSHQWTNPAFDAAIIHARSVGEEAARSVAVKAAEDIILHDCPVTGIWYYPSSWLISPRVSGGLEGMAPIIWPLLRLKDD